jgi:hypothetical protein
MDRNGLGTSPAAVTARAAAGPAAEAPVDYVVTAIFVLIGLVAFGLIAHARRETRFEPRSTLASARQVLGRSRLVVSVASGECPCGGMLGPSGTVSRRYGQLFGCTSCGSRWTGDGRRVIRRAARPRRRTRTEKPLGQFQGRADGRDEHRDEHRDD